jgi:large subunit ribosomal protein L6
MSRLIKKPILIPAGATITKTGDVFAFKGPKGELSMAAFPGIDFSIEDGKAWVKEADGLANKAMLGTFWSLATNAVEGVTQGFAKNLEIEGVGYRASIEGKDVVLFLGYALPVHFPIPEGVTIVVEKNTIKVSGIDKDAVGRAAAEIRALKKPEPYKGKGIHYVGEVIRRKVGKKAGTTA